MTDGLILMMRSTYLDKPFTALGHAERSPRHEN